MTATFNVERKPGEVILRPEGQPGEISLSLTYAQLVEKYGSAAALKMYIDITFGKILNQSDSSENREE